MCFISFLTLNNMKRVIVTFNLTILTFFHRIMRYKLTIANYKVRITIYKVRIAQFSQRDYMFSELRVYLTIIRLVYISQFWEKKGIIARYKLVIRRKFLYRIYIEFISRSYEKKNQNCEIKSPNNLFYFLISGGNDLPYYYLMHGLNIILHIRLNPQPLTKRSCKTTSCMCESCQAIFRNNILYREIARSRKGTSYARQRCGPFVFISMGLKITFHWFGHMSWRIRYKYSQCWNAVLCNNRRRLLVVSRSSHPEVSRKNGSPQKMYK